MTQRMEARHLLRGGFALDDAGACPARSINEGVRAVRVVYFGNDNPAGRRPLQDCCDIGGPNAPRRAVIKFDDVILVVLLDAHTSI